MPRFVEQLVGTNVGARLFQLAGEAHRAEMRLEQPTAAQAGALALLEAEVAAWINVGSPVNQSGGEVNG